MSYSVRRTSEREGGFALVMVLWIGLLIGIIGGSLIHEVRSERVAAASDAAELQGTLLAEAAINRAILSLIDPSGDIHWQIDGTPKILQIAGHHVTVSVVSEAGKVDLNAAPASLLSALLRGAQLSAADAEALADRVIAWRSPMPASAEDATANLYRDARRSYGPRHAPFRSVGELRMVLGMTDDLQSAVASLVTVYSGSPGVDRGVATDGVLRVLQASGDGFASSQLSARAGGLAAGVDRLPAAGEVFSVSARVDVNGAAVERNAVIRVGGDGNVFYKTLSWS